MSNPILHQVALKKFSVDFFYQYYVVSRLKTAQKENTLLIKLNIMMKQIIEINH